MSMTILIALLGGIRGRTRLSDCFLVYGQPELG